MARFVQDEAILMMEAGKVERDTWSGDGGRSRFPFHMATARRRREKWSTELTLATSPTMLSAPLTATARIRPQCLASGASFPGGTEA